MASQIGFSSSTKDSGDAQEVVSNPKRNLRDRKDNLLAGPHTR